MAKWIIKEYENWVYAMLRRSDVELTLPYATQNAIATAAVNKMKVNIINVRFQYLLATVIGSLCIIVIITMRRYLFFFSLHKPLIY